MSAAMASGLRILSLIPPMTQLNMPYPFDRLPDRLPAFARDRRDAGRHCAGAGARPVFSRRTARDPQMRGRNSAEKAFTQPARLRRTLRPLPRHRHPRHRLPAGARPVDRAPHLPAAISCPRGRASPHSTSISTTTAAIRWPGPSGSLGMQDRARHLATLYLERPGRRAARRRRSAFRIRPLRRIAGAQPAYLRTAGPGSRRPADAGRCDPRKTDPGGR